VDISTGTNDVWNILQLDLDSSRFYDNFKEDDLDVKLEVTSLATGTVVVDDVVLAPMVNLDGTWWAVVGGATPWLKGDTRIFSADARGATAIINYWLWRAYGDLVVPMLGWFPTSGTPSIADPS
jgi:predicted alpha-1,6-mannanase (GH76 family)